jgi:hypothetical protein
VQVEIPATNPEPADVRAWARAQGDRGLRSQADTCRVGAGVSDAGVTLPHTEMGQDPRGAKNSVDSPSVINQKGIPPVLPAILAPIIGVIALSVAIAGWDAAVFARRHFEQPRERLIVWARECGEAFESLLAASISERLRDQQQPPVRYALRAYALFDLIGDLDELDSFGRSTKTKWNLPYVERDVIYPVLVTIEVTTSQWHALNGADHGRTPLADDQFRCQVAIGLQRIGMFQEHLQRYERAPWIRTLLGRRRIRVRRRYRHEERAQRRRSGIRVGRLEPDVWVPV